MSALEFDIHASDGAARTGVVRLPRGEIRTPAFMPVGTAATVKAMMPESVRETGADILLGNTYHLMLRPGAERVAPERSIKIQSLLGSDIQMVLDECVALPASDAAVEKALALSTRWARRSKAAFGDQAAEGRALFGIVQGGTNAALRRRSAGELVEIGFDGYAIGGLAVGEGHELMVATIAETTPHLPANRPRYLMGVGKPRDLVEAVRRGVDMFDCVLPTRSGRNGQAFTRSGTVNLKNARHADDSQPLDSGCGCPACARYSRAYLHHLVKSGEILGAMLLTWHNLQYYQDLMSGMRAAIIGGNLTAFAADFYARTGQEEVVSPDGIEPSTL